ncbi:MAG: PepSY-associated TM helix domain-containing protein [Bacteroidota bacterium]
MEAFPEPKSQAGPISLNALLHPDLKALDPDQIHFVRVRISDYEKQKGKLTLNISYTGETQFMTVASKVIRLADGWVLQDKTPDTTSYADATILSIINLHYAHFGGFLMKVIYFILSLITCYVILSGVMIWLVAREKKTYAHKAKFNRNVGAIFIGACLGLFPAIALFFCLVKLFPNSFGMMSNVFLLFWLAYTIYAYFIKSPFKINKHALILAGGLGVLIPILNGIQSGLWFWKSLGMGYVDSFFVDVSWIVMSAISLWAALIAKPVIKKQREKDRFKEDEPKAKINARSHTNLSEPVLNINHSQR